MTEITSAIFWGGIGAISLLIASMIWYKMWATMRKCDICKGRIGTGSRVSEDGIHMHYECWKSVR